MTSRADAVGLVLARPARMLGLEPFFMELIAGIEETLAGEGRSLLLHVVPDHEAEIRAYRRWGQGQMVDAVVLVNLVTDDPRLDVLRELGIMPCSTVAQVNAALQDDGIAFAPVALLSPGLAALLALRARLGIDGWVTRLAALADVLGEHSVRVTPVISEGEVAPTRAVLEALTRTAREQGYHEALLHAQLSAAPFYQRAGFAARGPRFEEAGITHVEMVRAL